MGERRQHTRTHMAPTHMPQGALVKTGKSDNGEMDWEEYADTRVQKKKDGSVHYIYQSADHDVKQHSDMADGTQITYYKDGRRRQQFANGTVLEVDPEGGQKQTNPDGVSIQTQPNGATVQTNPDGSSIETFPDDAMLVLGGFPLGASPGGEVLKWPRIKRVQRTANSTHYVAADGTDVQVDSDGSKIVRWHIGQCKEADAHYGSIVWCMKVDPDGETHYLITQGMQVNALTGQASTSWIVDPYWKQVAEAKVAAELQKEREAKEKAEQAAAAKAGRQRAEKEKAAAKVAEDRLRAEEEERLASQRRQQQEDEEKAQKDREAAELAQADEAAQRKYYTEKYKLYPFIKFKNFLKQNQIPKGDVDNCLGKFELKKLAEKHGVAIPDDPKSLTAAVA